MIVLCGCEKGGVGKSTVAVNLAVGRARTGRDVLLVNADKQDSAEEWAETRRHLGHQPVIPAVAIRGQRLRHDVADLARRYDDIVIDCGGRDSLELRYAMSIAHIQIMPCEPSQFDVNTMYKMDRLVSEAKIHNPALRAVALVNKAPTNPAMGDTREMLDALADMQHYGVLDTRLYARKAYRLCGRDGVAVFELDSPDPKATAEVEALNVEVWGTE
jgi:chromosome partitioning protein